MCVCVGKHMCICMLEVEIHEYVSLCTCILVCMYAFVSVCAYVCTSCQLGLWPHLFPVLSFCTYTWYHYNFYIYIFWNASFSKPLWHIFHICHDLHKSTVKLPFLWSLLNIIDWIKSCLQKGQTLQIDKSTCRLFPWFIINA